MQNHQQDEEEKVQQVQQLLQQENLIIEDKHITETQKTLGIGTTATVTKVRLNGQFGGLTVAEKTMTYSCTINDVLKQSEREITALV